MALNELDILDIMEAIPHRYPILLVDKVLDMNGDDSAVGIKNVTVNEQVLQGHFPGHPIFPGVLILEALGQTAAITAMNHLGRSSKDYVVYFMSIDGAKFRKPVGPGDQLELHVKKEKNRGKVWKYHGQAKVNGVVHAEAHFTAMILKKEEAEL